MPLFRGRTAELEEAKSKQKFQRGPMQDVFWLGLFLVVVCGVAANLGISMKEGAFEFKGFTTADLGEYRGLFGGTMMIGFAVACAWMQLLACAPRAFTYIALFLPVVLTLPTVIIPLLMLLCYWWFWDYVQFTIVLVTAASDVFSKHRSLLVYGVLIMFLQVAWSVFAFASMWGAHVRMFEAEECLKQDLHDKTCGNAGLAHAALLGCGFAWLWGSIVIANIYHVTCSTTMAMWYFNGEANGGVSVTAAYTRASTTLMGTICAVSLLSTIIQIICATLKNALEQQESRVLEAVCVPVINFVEWLLEIFNQTTLVITAIYGVGITLAGAEAIKLFKSNGLKLLLSSDMVGTVAGMGTLMGTLVTGFCGALLTAVLLKASAITVPPATRMEGGDKEQALGLSIDQVQMVVYVLVVGCILGAQFLSVSGAALQALCSTLLVCFAEEPKKLQETHPETHAAMSEKVQLIDGTGDQAA